ncbi:MAG: S-layer homology domain-containing protein [Clostridia bacterium]|nr:S-layer homology domain-containing protein [Clostridia bacterium]
MRIMKNLKKVLAFVIVFTMMLGLSVSASVFPDVDDNASYAEAVTILDSLGIMYGDDNGNFRPEDTITRAEVATVVVRALGLDDAAAGAKGATQFNDVAADHWATGYINLATQKGIISGYGDGTFGPEDPVTYEQVTKMIVAALGYTPKADNNGGYPTGYLVIASQEGIAKGAAGSNGEPAKRSTVARLVFNALDVNLMEQTGFKVGEPEYEVVDKTLLTDCLNVDKYDGIVTATYLTKGTNVEDKSITIKYSHVNNEKVSDSDTFVEGADVDAASLYGMAVVAYVQEDEATGDDTIVAIAAKSGKNNVIVLDYSAVEDVTIVSEEDEDYVTKVEYFAKESDKSTTKIEIADTYSELYNGRAGDVEEWLDDPEPGSVTFIDNNNDDEYDYILVYAYTANYVVDSIDTAKNRVESKEGRISEIDIDDEDTITSFFNADGTAASFEDIEVGDVLTIIENAPIVMVYISKTVIEGSVDEERTDANGEAVYTISGSEYKVADEDLAVNVGDEGKFYLNIDNRIVAKDTTATVAADKYAYAYAAAVESGIGGAAAQIKFLAADGTWKTLDLAKKVTVYTDGVGTLKTTIPTSGSVDLGVVTIAKSGTSYTAAVNYTLFQYDVNSAGAINRIYVAGSTRNDDSIFTLDYSREDAVYSAKSVKLGSVYLGENTLVYSAPARDAAPADEDDIKLVSASAMFQDGNEYDIDVYDNDDAPAVIVVYGAESGIDLMSNILLVTRVTATTNAQGTRIQKIYGLQDGEEVYGETSEDGVTYVDADGEEVEGAVAAGDIVIFSFDAAGAIEKIYTIMDLSDVEDIIAGDADAFYATFDADEITADAFGFVAEKKNGRIALTNGLDGEDVVDFTGEAASISLSKANVYGVNLNRATPKFSLASASDVTAEDRSGKDANWLYVHMYDDVVIDAVVYTIELP